MHRSDNKTANTGTPAWVGFTMIEVLIVIAITIILFFLLIRPLTDTLRYTKDAQLQAAAQDSARKTMEIISREIGSAAYISDNCTHAFDASTGSSTPTTNGLQVDLYSNFLDVQVPKWDPASGQLLPNAQWTTAHLFNGKLDLVMARHAASNAPNGKDLYDPTAGNQPIQFQTGAKNLIGDSGPRIVATNLIFPLAPGTSMIRYFIGLKDPDNSYSNDRDHIFNSAAHNNTYVLYRAEFNPAALDSSNTPGVYLLFATDPTTQQPILDDPDFFRHVSQTDINWLDPAHAVYSASEMAAHNLRADAWFKIAKPIITAPEIDLIEMPHNSDRTFHYDGATDPFPGIAHYGGDWDPTTAKGYPVERASISFAPGVLTADAAPSTTTDYQERGIAGGANGVTGGLPYIPTLYQATGGNWTRPFSVNLYPQVSSGSTPSIGGNPYLITQAPTVATVGNVNIAAGDLVEYLEDGTPAPGTPVYDVTQGRILTSDAIPVSVNEDAGTINFSVPAVVGDSLPSGTTPNKFNREWVYDPPASSTSSSTTKAFLDSNGNYVGNTLDLRQTDSKGQISPLNNITTLDPSGGTVPGKYLKYAFITPGTLRIYGPDMTNGANFPGQGLSTGNTADTPRNVLYTEVSPNKADGPGANQYTVDYKTGIVTFEPLAKLMSTDPNNAGPFYWPSYPAATPPYQSEFVAIYDYQSNMRPNSTTAAIDDSATPPNPANPMMVKVSFHSRDYLNLTIGVRYIDSAGSSQNVVMSNTVKVGNLNR